MAPFPKTTGSKVSHKDVQEVCGRAAELAESSSIFHLLGE